MKENCENIFRLLPIRLQESNKGTFGHVLNVAGSEYYTGAAYFSSLAPLKTGCGRSTLASTDTVLRTISCLSPDIILMPLKKLNKETIRHFQVISTGCGLSTDKKYIQIFEYTINLLKDSSTPLVIDADGLNILSKLKKIQLPKNTVLTPHPKELGRLMGVPIESVLSQPEFWVKKCCEKYNCTTVLKMHKTLISDNKGNLYTNLTGNSALAHGGSGDVLCGMISGLLAQGLEIVDACRLAVYLHGHAGKIASNDLTEYSVLASDLLNYIPKAIKRIIET